VVAEPHTQPPTVFWEQRDLVVAVLQPQLSTGHPHLEQPILVVAVELGTTAVVVAELLVVLELLLLDT
jgi:hypothetical protein